MAINRASQNWPDVDWITVPETSYEQLIRLAETAIDKHMALAAFPLVEDWQDRAIQQVNLYTR